MFLVTCAHCSHQELRGHRGVVAVRDDGGALELVFRCTRCDHDAVLRTGSARDRADAVPAA